MPLTNTAIRSAKPREKAYKLFDGRGLFLLIKPAGKYWRCKYRFAGKEKTLALGVYPDVSLKSARARRDDARKLLADGVDPMHVRKAEKAARVDLAANSFEMVAQEWFAKFAPSWVDSHADRIIRRLRRDIFPWIGRRPIVEISAPELMTVLCRIGSRGAIETAHRAKQNCSQVFSYAVATGRAERNPCADLGESLKKALPPGDKKHHSSITEPQAVGELLRAIDSYRGSPVTMRALRLAPLVFVRPGELRRAEWAEFNLDGAEWRIPAEKMKMRVMHIVPLATQSLVILRELQALTGAGRYVFPSIRTAARPMSENTVNAALRRLGYSKDEMTGHGFRSMASTILNEQGWHRDAIERQLAHAERDQVRAAYNYAEHLPERRKMMQAWADYLDRLALGAEVVPLRA